MNCYVGSHAAGVLIYYGGYLEYCSMSFLEHVLRPGDATMDTGAAVVVKVLGVCL